MTRDMTTTSNSAMSMWQAIKRTAKLLIFWSVGYYFIRFSIAAEGSLLSFLLVDIGYFVVLIMQVLVILRGVQGYGNFNPNFSLGKGMRIGAFGSILGKLISFPVMIIMGNYIFPGGNPMLNTVGILGFPIALLWAAISGAIVGGISGLFVK